MQELLLSAAMIHGCGLEGSAVSTLQHTAKTHAFHIDYKEDIYSFRGNGLGLEVETRGENDITVLFSAGHNFNKDNSYFNQRGSIKWDASQHPNHGFEPFAEISQFVIAFTTVRKEHCSIDRTTGKIGFGYTFHGSDFITPSFQIGFKRDLRHNMKFKSLNEFEGWRIANQNSIEASASLILNHDEKHQIELGGRYEYGLNLHRRAMETFISLQRRF